MNADYAEFNEQLLADIYDAFCPLDKDSDFFLNEVKKIAPSTLLDVGCGSGILTVELAKIAERTIGVEPAAPMIDIARKRLGNETVSWIHGFAQDITDQDLDVVIMTSHVAQFFLSDAEWGSLLKHLAKLLKSGGKLIFDSKNPLPKPWLLWDKATTQKTRETRHGEVTMWNELTSAESNHVKYQLWYKFDDGKELVSNNELIYRSKDELINSLKNEGFRTDVVYGDWNGAIANNQSEELIFIATKE